MSRCIDADALQKEYMHEHDGKRLMLIDVAPTIEPERKKGEWQLVRADRYIYRCDVCKKNTFGMSDYCPNCGARMEGEG